MADQTTTTRSAKSDDKDVETEEITITVRKDFDSGLRAALLAQLQAGTDATRHLVVGNFADLQRAGAEVVAAGDGEPGKGSGFAAGVRMNPNVDSDEAKAGAERTLREEEAAKTPPEAVEPPDATGADAVHVVDPTSTSPQVQSSSTKSKASDNK